MKRRLLGILLASMLAGCGTNPSALRSSSTNGTMAAKSFSQEAIMAVVSTEEQKLDSVFLLKGLPAVMAAPTDAIAQNTLLTLYDRTSALTAMAVDSSLDGSVSELSYAQVKAREITDKPDVVAYLQSVSDRLTTASGVPPFKVHLINDPNFNAFNAGGNSMFVLSGLLSQVKDEAELAGVMAHEMTHGLKRHVILKLADQVEAQSAENWEAATYPTTKADDDLASAYISTSNPNDFMTNNDFDYDKILFYLKGKVSDAELTKLKFSFTSTFTLQAASREVEAQADAGGVRMLNAAGYDPSALADVFDRLNVRPDGDLRYYDHPALGQRIASMRGQIAQENLTNPTMDRGADRLAKGIVSLKSTPPVADSLPKQVTQLVCF